MRHSGSARAPTDAAGDNRAVIDPLERWREYGEKPDYAGLLTFGGAPYTQDPAELGGRRRRDRRRADGRPRLRPAGRALRPARDPRGELPARAAPRGRSVDAFAELRIVDFGDAAGACRPTRPRSHAAIEQLVGQVVDAGALADRARRRPLDRRAGRPRVRRATTAASASSTSTRTPTPAARSSASRSRTGRRCTGSSRQGTSTRRATSRSACAATGRASSEFRVAGRARDHELLHARRPRARDRRRSSSRTLERRRRRARST